MHRPRSVAVALPTEVAVQDGLAYSLWLPPPDRAIGAGVLILHGAGSCKESHHDYARVVRGAGFAALAFDQRGHGDSDSPMDGRVLEDVGCMAALLRDRMGSKAAPLAVRGSSMGGYLAILASPAVGAAAVVAICPASPEGLRRGLRAETLRFEADVPELEAFLSTHDLAWAVASLRAPLLLLHAEGDEQVPVQHSHELSRCFSSPRSRLITVPGGHHRSIQHDPELQAISLRFIEQAIAG